MVRFGAIYYDGETSRPHDVQVELVGEASKDAVVQIQGSSVSRQLVLSDVKIAPRLGNTVRSLSLPDGAKCETQENDAVDELARRAGVGAGLSLVHRLESRWKTALGAVLATALLCGAGFIWGVPWLAAAIAHALPPQLASDLGRGTLQALDATWFESSELASTDQARLAAKFENMAAKYPKLPLKLHFRRAGMPNAFALPDGSVIVTDELVELAEQDEEVLSVLAHEIGHVHHRHSLRMALESSSTALLLTAYLGDATQISAAAASLPTVYAQAHYSRSHEEEADTFALQYLQDSGIAPQNFSRILRRLQKSLGAADSEDGPMRYLASHPPTSERIARFE